MIRRIGIATRCGRRSTDMDFPMNQFIRYESSQNANMFPRCHASVSDAANVTVVSWICNKKLSVIRKPSAVNPVVMI